jgi:hypothetical protein
MAFKSNKGAISWSAKGATVEVERAALIRLTFPKGLCRTPVRRHGLTPKDGRHGRTSFDALPDRSAHRGFRCPCSCDSATMAAPKTDHPFRSGSDGLGLVVVVSATR